MLLFATFSALPTPSKKKEHIHALTVDESLLSEIGAGSQAAFAAFYHQTKGAVYAFAPSMLKNH